MASYTFLMHEGNLKQTDHDKETFGDGVSPPNVALDRATQERERRKRHLIEKRGAPEHLADLFSMDHPDFTHHDSVARTLRAHMDEMHKRGVQEWTFHNRTLTKREAEMVTDALETIEDRFKNTDAEVARLSKVPTVKNVTFEVKPINWKALGSGLLTGAAAVFVPGLRDAANGVEALAVVKQCFDPFQQHEVFMLKDFWGDQNEMGDLTDDDIVEFGERAAERNFKNDGIGALLDDVLQMSETAWKVWKKAGVVLKKLQPYILNLIRHMYVCGYADLVIGIVIAFIIGLFPPLLLVLIPLGVILLGVEIVKQITEMVKWWKKDWFKVGKAIGLVIAYIAMIVIAYKNSRAKDTINCSKEGTKGCNYEMPKNENDPKAWSQNGFQKHCPPGNTCNKVYKRNEIVDPFRKNADGIPNYKLGQQGNAMIGPDGKTINLHHVSQSQGGEIAELTRTYHSKNHGALHHFLEHGQPSKIDRQSFGSWRSSYWKARGKEMEEMVNAGTWVLNTGGKSSNSLKDLIPTGLAVVKGIDERSDDVKKLVEGTLDRYIDGSETREEGDSAALDGSLGLTDIIGYILRFLKGKLSSKVDGLNKDHKAMLDAQFSEDPKERLHACSWNATCSGQCTMSAETFDAVDAVVEKDVSRNYRVHFAPDSGYALSVRTLVSVGKVKHKMARVSDGGWAQKKRASGADVSSVVVANGVRAADTSVVGMEYWVDDEFSSTYQFTLQHCDGYGLYDLTVTGDAYAQKVEPVLDPEWVEFWEKNGGEPQGTRSAFDLNVQYVAYPTLTSQAVSGVATTTEVTFHLLPMKANLVGVAAPKDDTPYYDANGNEVEPPFRMKMPDEKVKYHVFYTDDMELEVRDVCDVQRLTTFGMTHAKGDNEEMVVFTLGELSSGTDYRFFVIAENQGGAMALYGADGDKADKSMRSSESLLICTASRMWIAWLILSLFGVCLLVIGSLYAARARGAPLKLPFYDKHLRRVRLK